MIQGVREALGSLSGVTVCSVRARPATFARVPGYDVQADVKGQPVVIAVEFMKSGYPRDLKDVVARAPVTAGRQAVPRVVFVAAPMISPGGRELLRRHHAGYWDAGGSLYLELPWALYQIDRPAVQPERPVRELFRGRTAQVLHCLLHEPDRSWHVHELAELAGVSPYTVHQALTHLGGEAWMEKRGSGPQTVRRLHRPGDLLDAWAHVHSLRRNYRWHGWYLRAKTTAERRTTVCQRLEAAGIEYALTLNSGAELIAPHAVGFTEVHALLPATVLVEELAPQMGLKPAVDGGNVRFMGTRDRAPLMFRHQLDGGEWVASDVQLYLDLMNWPKRGKEQAQHLRSLRLPY